MFKATMMKFFAASCLYIYLALAIYYTFTNAYLIPVTGVLGAAFAVGIVLDIFVIDTICALVSSLFGKNDGR